MNKKKIKKKIKKSNKKGTIKNNIKLLINKYKSSSKKAKIAITSSLVTFILLLIFIIFYNVNINLKADANISVSPDPQFDDVNFYKCVVKQYYKNINKTPAYNHKFKREELESLKTLTCNSSNVTSTKGIKLMKNLENLDLRNNQIKTLSVHYNTKLIKLYASKNQLTSIGINNNPSLIYLELNDNDLEDVQLQDKITALQELHLSHNRLNNNDSTNIQNSINKLSNLKILYIDQNNLTSLSVVNNTKLEVLIASKNQLSSIDLHNNANLKHINFNNNQLTNITIRDHDRSLEEIHLKNNQINAINLSLQTKLKFLDLSGNNLSSINLDNNSNLEYLYLGMDTDTENYGNNITSLSIANNPNLKYLNAPNNKLEEIGIHQNNNLTFVNLNNNQLTNASFYDHVANLKELYLKNNKLTSVDVSDATNLQKLVLFNNRLDTIDLKKNTILKYLSLAGNNLTSIDLNDNEALETLILGYDTNNVSYGNQLSELHLTHHHNLVKLFASHNNLTRIDLHLNEKLVNVDLQDNKLTHLDLSALTALQKINLTQAFVKNIQLPQNNSYRYDLITLPNNSNFHYSVNSISDSTIVSNDGTTIVGNETANGQTNVRYIVPGDAVADINYIVGDPSLAPSTTCDQETYTITWNWNNNTETSTVNCGEYITVPETIDKEIDGYKITGWSLTENGELYILNTPVTSDISLYAVYSEKQSNEPDKMYNVTFYKENDESYITIPVESGKTVEAPENPVSDRYTFNYWKLENSDTAFDFSTPITSDINLYADLTLKDKYNLLDELIINYTTSNGNDISQSVSAAAFNLEDSYTFPINNLTSEKAEVEVVPKDTDTDITGDKGKITLESGENSFQVVLKKGSVTETYNYKVIATFEKDNSASSTTDGTGTSNGTCRGVLSSSKYEINNDSLLVGKVPQTESNETIFKNISADCGTVTVYDDSIVIVYNNQTKTYKINRYWSPQTGIKVIKYGLIIGIIFVITLGLILINKKIRKKW